MKNFKKKNPRILFDENIMSLLKSIVNNIEIIIESGTFDGLGSTTFLSEIFKNSNTLEKLYTIEVDNRIYIKARKNLKKYPFVECLNGLTLKYQDCIDFMKKDEYVNNHENIDFIHGDDFINNDAFLSYKLELEGRVFHSNSNIDLKDFEENILINKINENINRKLLILLDSSGGIGYLEFLKTIELLKNKTYYLLLDDIDHLKHYRSYQYIKNNENFKILYINEINGNLLCVHN